MKILTPKEQLFNKLDDVDNAIKYANIELTTAYERKQRKQIWGIYSFIGDSQWTLTTIHENKIMNLELLIEYRGEIQNRINNVDEKYEKI